MTFELSGHILHVSVCRTFSIQNLRVLLDLAEPGVPLGSGSVPSSSPPLSAADRSLVSV